MSEDRFDIDPARSSRDRGDVQARLTQWLRSVTGDQAASVTDLSVPAGSGMSSETILFDGSFDGGTHRLVARLAPTVQDTPVFRSYDLEMQFRLLRLVAAESSVPVPVARWLEVDPEPIGSPFFVMDRVDGRVPRDIPPYLFEGWLLDADPADQEALQRATVGVVADLHGIDPSRHDTDFLEIDAPGETALRRHFNDQLAYYDWVRGDRRHPVVEDGLAWLEDNWPDEGPSVITWGDARIGNVMYASDGFEPVAVFDWEMAAMGPAELDLGWMCFLHSFFQNIAEVLEVPGMPSFMRAEDVAAMYTDHCGRPVRDLRWFEIYTAVRHAIIMSRITDRMIAFGEREGWPDDVDEVIPHRNLLRSMLDESNPPDSY